MPSWSAERSFCALCLEPFRGLATYSGRPGQASPALGLVLVGAATVLLVPTVTASLSKVLAGVVIALTSVRFYLTGAYELSSAPGWKEAAGLAGLVLAVVALHAGLAFELEDSRSRQGGNAVSQSRASAISCT